MSVLCPPDVNCNICLFFQQSLSLESAFKAKISERINEKVLASDGTWIDWQYLTDVVNVLTKCRYGLIISHVVDILTKCRYGLIISHVISFLTKCRYGLIISHVVDILTKCRYGLIISHTLLCCQCSL